MNNDFVKSFTVSSKKDEKVFCFMNLYYDKQDGDVTSSYNFGYSLENMDSEELYKCILTVEKHAILLYCACLDHDVFYTVVDDVEISTSSDDIVEDMNNFSNNEYFFVDLEKYNR